MASMSACDIRLRNLFTLAVGVCTLVVGVLAGAADLAVAGKNQVSAVAARLGGNEDRTRFVTDFSQSVDYTVKVLSNPFRVIVDLPEVDFNFPPGLGRRGRGWESRAPRSFVSFDHLRGPT